MADNIVATKVVYQGGLTSVLNHISLSDNQPGMATRLVNFETSLYGGYRRLSGYQPYDASAPAVDSAGAEGRILFVVFFNQELYTARKQKSGNTYEFYKWNVSTGWTKLTTGLTRSSVGVTRIRSTVFNYNGTNTIAFADGVNKACLFNGTTWTEISSSNTGADYAHAGGNQALNAPKYVHSFKGHLFFSGDPTYPHIVTHSAPNAEYNFTVAAGAGQIIASFEVNQIKPFRNALYVFSQIGIKKIEVNSSNFVISDVTFNIGCLAPDSVVEIGGSLLFLSQDGFRPISGTNRLGDVEIETVSKEIQKVLTDRIAISDMSECNTLVLRSKSQVRTFFPSTTRSAVDTYGIIGCLKGTVDGIGWEWGELKGFQSVCSASAYIGAVEVVVHGDYSGNVFKQEIGSSFNGANVEAVFRSPYIDFGAANVRKTMKKIQLFTRIEGAIALNAAMKYDWGKGDKLNPSNYLSDDFSLNSNFYGNALYGHSVYGGEVTPVIEYDVEGTCFSAQVTFTTNDVNPPYSLQGILYEYHIEGKK